MYYHNGDVYVGNFSNDKRHGFGQFYDVKKNVLYEVGRRIDIMCRESGIRIRKKGMACLSLKTDTSSKESGKTTILIFQLTNIYIAVFYYIMRSKLIINFLIQDAH